MFCLGDTNAAGRPGLGPLLQRTAWRRLRAAGQAVRSRIGQTKTSLHMFIYIIYNIIYIYICVFIYDLYILLPYIYILYSHDFTSIA